MRIRIAYIALLLFMSVVAKANPVSERHAREVGLKFLNATQKMNVKDTDALRLVKTYRCATGEAAFYVFNTNTGYVIVSADDCATPILGYSYEGPFNTEEIPVQLQDYLNSFLRQIEHGITNHQAADETIAAQWENVRTTGRIHANRSKGHVDPLLRESWDQLNPYNIYCPVGSSGYHVPVGCVATAMAQIMHYWGYPEHGQGSHSYTPSTHPEYGVQSADFSAATYRWDKMPYRLYSDSNEEEIDAVATLMYHCGVSVDMMYSPGGSGAYSSDVPRALVDYFNYPDDLRLIIRNQQDDATWLANIKACLDLYRPVHYSGQGSEGGHAFVCDGYDDDDLLHFNWGWGGSSDGFFALNETAYSNDNSAIINIHAPLDHNHTCQITVTANTSNAGAVSEGGVYHLGDICRLSAQAFPGYRFRAWLEDGNVVSQEPEYSFLVMEDRHLEAFFAGEWLAHVEADRVEDQVLYTQSAVLSWVNGTPVSGDIHDEWPLLARIPCHSSYAGVATDGQYIYIGTWADNQDSLFYKCDLAGNIIESFNVEGCGKVYDLTYDGRYYYGSQSGSDLYCIDIDNKTLVDVIHPSYSSFRCCAYDPDYDGFWVDYGGSLKLMDRNGQFVKDGPAMDSYFSAAYYKNTLGEPHLLVMDRASKVYDYDINADVLGQEVLCQIYDGPYIANAFGSFVGEYMGKTAFFGVLNYNFVAIYEIPAELSQVQLHRVYRVEGEVNGGVASSDPELIADRLFGSSFTDHAFDTLPFGIYTYGVSLLTDGIESQIRWSNPIEHIRHFVISARVQNGEGGTVSGEGRYEEGAICTLTATPAPRYSFIKWMKNGNVVSTDPVLNITVTEEAEYIACFEKTVFEINAYTQPVSSGIVSGSGTYNKGETVTLKVIPNANYRFLKWTENGEFLSSETTYLFVATVDRTIYANLAYNHGVDEHDQVVLSLHPNPVNDKLLVESSQVVRRCEIFSVSGALVYTVDEVNASSVEIGVANLAPGLYLIRITTEGYSLTEKFEKQ